MLRARRRFLNAGHMEVSELVPRRAHVSTSRRPRVCGRARPRAARGRRAREAHAWVRLESDLTRPGAGLAENKKPEEDAHPSDRKYDRSVDRRRVSPGARWNIPNARATGTLHQAFGTAGGYSAGINAPGGDATLDLPAQAPTRRIRRAKAPRHAARPTPASRPPPPPPLGRDCCGEGWWLSRWRAGNSPSRVEPHPDASRASPRARRVRRPPRRRRWRRPLATEA